MANKLILLILFYILSCNLGQEIIKTLSGPPVHLQCHIMNSTEDVTWEFNLGSSFIPIYTCYKDGSCERSLNNVDNIFTEINARRNNDVSILSFLQSRYEETFECHVGDEVVKEYEVYQIDDTDINEYCNVSFPSISKIGDHQIMMLCGFTLQRDLDLHANLTIEGLDINYYQRSSRSIYSTLPLDDNFKNISDANCEIYFPDINVTRTCAYPVIIKTNYVVEGNGIIVESDDESELEWHLFGKDGKEEDILNRTWTRDGGRSLLILQISKEDEGKVIIWRTKSAENDIINGTIGFTIISDIPGDSNKQDPKDKNPALQNDDGPFFVLALLFLTLWLITFVVGGIILFCRGEKCKTSENATPKSPNSNQSSNVKSNGNVGSGEHGTPLVRFTTEATNPDISNTNNSAHTPVLERDDGNDDTLNHQSPGDGHLYFTLEKSPSAMSSFRRATAPRWNPGDANSATLDQEQDSLWQGYATVGESNENATCSYDIGEYAEVGEHLLGKGPPVQSIRPPVRKKPGREEVKEDDISKLYGKVNK